MSRGKWKNIILHHSLTEDGDTLDFTGIKRYHENKGFDDIGYHFLIELMDKKVVMLCGRPLYMDGAHTLKGFNKNSIGICVVGNFNLWELDNKIMDKLVDMLTGLCYTLDLSTSAIKAHKEADDRRNCPGDFFPTNEIRNKVALKLKELTKTPKPSVEKKKEL